MIESDDEFERRVASWLRDDAPDAEPAGLLRTVLARTATTRRRPGWAARSGGMPSVGVERWPAVRLPYATRLLAVAAVVATLVGGLVVAGSMRPLPAPTGPARAGVIAADSEGDIVIFDADGSHRRNLTSSPDLDTSPTFSPDGTMIAYWSAPDLGQPASLWVMNADGSAQHNVTGSNDFEGNEGFQAAWAPDSRHLAFSVGDYFSSMQLYVVNADGTDLHPVGSGSLSRSDPAWSPDGRLIAFRGHTIGVLPDAYPPDPAIGVYVIAPDGTGQVKVSRSARAGGTPNLFGGPYAGTAPSWSPDGRSLLFATGAADHHTLAIASLDGKTERAIMLPAGDDLLPIFSPDGLQIAFETYSASASQVTAYVVNTDGTGLHAVTATGLAPLNPIFWSPDGQRVVTYGTYNEAIELVPANSVAAAPPLPTISIVLGAPPPIGVEVERASWQRLAP
jgi:dipeptidyl aminopeptidase/acylaminoacyl peptidase